VQGVAIEQGTLLCGKISHGKMIPSSFILPFMPRVRFPGHFFNQKKGGVYSKSFTTFLTPPVLIRNNGIIRLDFSQLLFPK
ncbi:MAG: hypothetical protein IJI14_13210, partial [Anaerolineaceae bacterium]|nr:hypothetical protein [Anaerolineaceae bacterium]